MQPFDQFPGHAYAPSSEPSVVNRVFLELSGHHESSLAFPLMALTGLAIWAMLRIINRRTLHRRTVAGLLRGLEVSAQEQAISDTGLELKLRQNAGHYYNE